MWFKIRHGVPQGSILGPLLFLIYINDLPKTINDRTIPMLFADDTSLLVISSNHNDLYINSNIVFRCINEWFEANQLTINFEQTHHIIFTACDRKLRIDTEIVYENKQITTVTNTKILGMYVDDNMSWKCHIEHISSKLSTACYIIRSIKQYISVNTLKKV
jgi:hypothetical protein